MLIGSNMTYIALTHIKTGRKENVQYNEETFNFKISKIYRGGRVQHQMLTVANDEPFLCLM